MTKNKRILIFNVNWLGDVLFSTAAIRNIRYNFPESFIACAIPRRCHPILECNPNLDEIITFDEKGTHKGVFGKLRFIGFLRKKRFDIVFLLHRSFSRALICRMAGIPERIGYYTRKRAFLLTKNIPLLPLNTLRRVDYYLNIIREAGLTIRDSQLEFFVGGQDISFVEKFLKDNAADNGFLAVINPGGNWLPKRWPKEYWACLADRLINEFKAKVVVTGSDNDAKLVSEIQNLMCRKLINSCGIFKLKHLGALAKRADLFITADTGPLHIAHSVGAKKIIALFGPTSIDITGPYPRDNVVILQKDVGCPVPCYKVNCPNNRCMQAISAEEVMEVLSIH